LPTLYPPTAVLPRQGCGTIDQCVSLIAWGPSTGLSEASVIVPAFFLNSLLGRGKNRLARVRTSVASVGPHLLEGIRGPLHAQADLMSSNPVKPVRR
jgi:hypothetical protein